LPHLISSLTGGPAPGASGFGPLGSFQEAVPGVNTNWPAPFQTGCRIVMKVSY